MRLPSLLLCLAVLTFLGCSKGGAHGTNADPNAAPPAAATAGSSGATGAATSGVSGMNPAMAGARATSTGAAGMTTSIAGTGAAGTTRSPATAGAAGMSVATTGSGGAATTAGAPSQSGPTSGASGSPPGSSGQAGNVAGSGGGAGRASGAGLAAAGSGGATPGASPVYHIPLRVHMQASDLSNAELGPILSELNRIWLTQGGVCFEVEVTESETNLSDGFDFRYTSGQIPGASGANGLTQSAHSIWSIDHPRLNAAKMPVVNPAARTTAHELGHGLGLDHENPPPSSDCASPCYCAQRGDDCDEYLMRSGTQGFFLSPPEIEIARRRAANMALANRTEMQCGQPMYMR